MDTHSTNSSLPSGLGVSNKITRWEPNFSSYTAKERPLYARQKSIKPFAMILTASRNRGKSFLIKHLYQTQWKNKFDLVILFSNTILSGGYDYINKPTKYSEYDEDIITQLWDIQETQKEENGYMLNILVVLDDCISNAVRESQALSDLFTKGRHALISVVFSTQNPVQASQTFRQNCNYSVMLKTMGRGKEHLINSYLLDLVDPEDCQSMKPYKYMNQILKEVWSEPYQALVIEYDKQGDEIQDCVFHYRVEQVSKK